MRNQDMKTASVHVAKQNTEAADPAPTKEQDHENSMPDSTATEPPMGRVTASDDRSPRPIGEILRELFDIRERAHGLLRTADPVAVELYQQGFRDGIKEGERLAGERAQRAADEFLNYLAEEPAATPRPIPPLEHYWRAAA